MSEPTFISALPVQYNLIQIHKCQPYDVARINNTVLTLLFVGINVINVLISHKELEIFN